MICTTNNKRKIYSILTAPRFKEDQQDIYGHGIMAVPKGVHTTK